MIMFHKTYDFVLFSLTEKIKTAIVEILLQFVYDSCKEVKFHEQRRLSSFPGHFHP